MPPQHCNGPDKKPGLADRIAKASCRWQSISFLKYEKCAQPRTLRQRSRQPYASASLEMFWPSMSRGDQATLSSKHIGVVVVVVVTVCVVVDVGVVDVVVQVRVEVVDV